VKISLLVKVVFGKSFFTKIFFNTFFASLSIGVTLAEDKMEEETYSLIYTSLKHPIRRRILRMLADKPLAFSEILEILTIDSGHLSYHLESLGDLIVRSKDGKYKLSSFGAAAMRLMGGVEENYSPSLSPKQKNRISRAIPKVFSIVLTIILIGMSVIALSYTTPISTATLNQDDIFPTPFVVDGGQTFEFNVTINYWGLTSKYDDTTLIPMGNEIVPNQFYLGPYGPSSYTLAVEPPQASLTAQAKGRVWLDFRLNTTSRTTGAIVLMPFGFPNDLVVDVYVPTGTSSLGELEWTYGRIDHFTSPVVEVNELGTYRFLIKNNDSGEWTGVLRPYVEWQITEKPYFYYGIAGFAAAFGYLTLVTIQFLRQQRKEK
jgi:DNA-binding transcriptional ArsR family regulator